MNTIDPSLYLSNQKAMREPKPTLDKDGFLQILMTQMQNQDPTQPMDSQAMIEQMTSLTSLEQMMNISSSIDNLVQSQLISPVIQYSHMIGKEVTYQAYDPITGESLGEKASAVVAVSQNEGWAMLELENGEKIYADAALKVSTPDSEEDVTE
ncbi:flagellar hook capping FlgD N-terminal domain-containing protein [Oceanobacillus chungangensis]|uniref:Flagellar hook assembly protein FlgD n=1 Tax=Oceanobacillus chungangensis TaxID=1229152 RepID=A0A3D8PRB2_9BACI|nr:flagellar hook capping FlgD N-terminal domain-containing protein [Oceanobacillus chungangensis]RDW17831.1 flagellar hook assembly protein FlgD [Oceanobacillus chungangensis]